MSRRWVFVLGAVAIAVSQIAATAPDKRRSEIRPFPNALLNSELLTYIRLLKELEAGNIEAAKKILNMESSACILGLDELAGRNATPEALAGEPALRAAVRYWGVEGPQAEEPFQKKMTGEVLEKVQTGMKTLQEKRAK